MRISRIRRPENVDQCGANNLPRAGRSVTGHSFLVDDPIAERDPIRNVVAEVRVIPHLLGVAGPHCLGAIRQDLAIGVLDDNVLSVVPKTAIQVMGVVRIDLRLNDV